jgi:hypothetical protein
LAGRKNRIKTDIKGSIHPTASQGQNFLPMRVAKMAVKKGMEIKKARRGSIAIISMMQR